MALPLLVMLIWRSETHGGRPAIGSTGGSSGTGSIWRCATAGNGSTSASLIVPALVFLYALVSRKLTLSRNLAFSAIVLAICFAILPRIIFGSAYADMRLVPYLIAVAVLAIRFRGAPDRRTAQVLAVLGLVFFGTRTAANTISLAMAANDQSAKLEAIELMPPGARVVSSGRHALQRILADAAQRASRVQWSIVRRDGFANDQWVIEGINLLDLKYT